MPRKKEEKRKAFGSIMWPPETYEQIRKEADSIGVSFSDVVRMAVSEYFRHRGGA